jgi:hypothetical protein
VIRLVIGLLKGAIIGAGIGYGAHTLATQTGFSNAWLTYGVIGAVVGMFVGRPFWSLIRDPNATSVVALLKAAFGFGVGCGLYAIVAKVWQPSLTIAEYDVFSWAPSLGGAIGAVWGGFVELDDAIGGEDKAATPSKAKKRPSQAD